MIPAFDTEKALRRIKPEKQTARIKARPRAALTFVEDVERAGPPLLLDTCVYIHVLTGRTPRAVDALLATRTIQHSATAIGELTNRFGSRIPVDEPQRSARRELAAVIADIPAHRTTCPTTTMWGEAGIVTGVRSRIGGFGRGQDQDGLNDALILLQAAAVGAHLLTANVADFDILQQIVPSAQVIFYGEERP